ncbi:helix-turn-helix domain-containing protein [Shouchella lehensis]|uniref:XRE family transcriptional regulator n=1 Tax=Shouchella lehensis TaxID=300825 RepID=A0A4Y7WIY5_9BACI|nr:helix-turn-helix transcriptional regulator [Shouchella lehensis]MBG9785601.1 transcriptional regulator [Shouchella lehensis]TES48051.1 XRE family transcriptional regulator [Shouchella lehensis]
MGMKNRLRILMAEKGINSVSELHRLIQEQGYTMSRRTLDKFVRNENNRIDYDTIVAIIKVLECSFDDLFVITDEEEEQN